MMAMPQTQHSAEASTLFAATASLLRSAAAPKTMSGYQGHWLLFRAFCAHFNFEALPAEPRVVAAFLTYRTEVAVAKNLSYAVVKSASAAIHTAHELAGFSESDSPTKHPLVKRLRRAAKKRIGIRAVHRKDPIDQTLLLQAVQLYIPHSGTPDCRRLVATMVAVAFSGFLRYADFSAIFADQVTFFESHMEIFLDSRKNDQFRQGHVIPIARGHTDACPVHLTEEWIRIRGLAGKHLPLFPAWDNRQSAARGSSPALHSIEFQANRPIPYHLARSEILSLIAKVLGCSFDDIRTRFGAHSLRSGGATAAATRVEERLFQRQGGWRSQSAMYNYIEDPLEQRLLVTQALGL